MIRGKQTALMEGTEDHVGYWITPKPLMETLEAEFHFTDDVCPYPRPAGFDGLREPWGARNWCNPPFERGNGVMAWVRKAIAENAAGKLCVVILSVNQIEHATGAMLAAGAEARLLPPIAWVNPAGESNPRAHPAVLFILRPKPATLDPPSTTL